jgi:hypothetical protein
MTFSKWSLLLQTRRMQENKRSALSVPKALARIGAVTTPKRLITVDSVTNSLLHGLLPIPQRVLPVT